MHPLADGPHAGGIAQLLALGLTSAPLIVPAVSVAVPAAGVEEATLVRIIQTSSFSPPCPDPSGLTYIPTTGKLMVCDGEVEEMSIFAGKNLFTVNLSGTLASSSDTMDFSIEPVGLAFNPVNGHLFVSDDDAREVYEVVAGNDGVWGSNDDTVTQFDTVAFGCDDPEGIAYDIAQNALFIIDGTGSEVFRVGTGPNGKFDGVPSKGGDDVTSHFDVATFGLEDPEGITYNPGSGTLYMIDAESELILETTTAGVLIRTISFAQSNLDGAAGLDFAPGGANPSQWHLYVCTRGADNNSNPNENDGKIYEFSISGVSAPGNTAPWVVAGPDQTVGSATGAVLDGTVTDDNKPNPPASVTTTWSKVSGPGSVTFGNASQVDTTAAFSVAGVYVLRLTANDSALTGSDELTVTVLNGSFINVQSQVAASSDDAEEDALGIVTINSSDLELVTESTVQTVGMRFPGLSIPKGSVVATASLQFRTDAVASGVTSLTIQAQAIDNAPTFTTAPGSISSRLRTTAAVVWTPAPWTTVGESGPAQQTVDISPVIQEVVNRPGWASGNALVIIVTGSGKRVATAFNGLPSGAPKLLAQYGTATPGNQAPQANAGPDQSVAQAAGAVLNGTVSDDGLPNPPGALTTTWSKVSGPGTVGFANAAAVDTTATFSLAGTYVLRLTANDGALATSDDATITVAPTNAAPSADAGPGQLVSLAAGAVLDGTVSDDGNPNPPGSLTTTWSKVSGPGTVSFGNASQVDTTAAFTAAGVYVLRLTANDGALTASDELTVNVTNGSFVTAQSQVATGSDDAEESATGSVSLTSGDLELVTDSTVQTVGLRFTSLLIPQGAAVPFAFIQFETDEVSSGATSLTIQGQAIDNAPTFTGTPSGISSRARTTASVVWTPAPWTTVGEMGPSQQTIDISPVIQEIVNRPGWVSGNALAIIITGSGSRVAMAFNGVPAGAPRLLTQHGPAPPVNQPPSANAGPDQSVSQAAGATLDGTVTDDGLPNPPGAVTSAWSKVSGPGTVGFGNSSAVDTTATFSTPGTYVLRLTANDGGLQSSDDATVTVSPNNQAPTADAGPDQTVSQAAGAILDGTVTDDGLPNPPGALTTAWSKVSGPGTVGFANAAAVDTTASFSTPGTYVLRLTANDGALTANDGVTITVTPNNQAPSVNAGSDQSVTQAAGAILDGTVTDDGLPAPPLVTTQWTMFSGPAAVSFGNAASIDTTASFPQPGSYVLRLTANDGALLSTDDVNITVVPNNQPPTVDAGTNQSVNLADGASLDGTVTDDGLPHPPLVTTQWTKFSGPGTASFDNAAAVDTTASFSAAGIYVLRLTANDGALGSSDDVTVTVVPSNEAPVVDAGPEQSVNIDVGAVLDGTVTDDGLPNPPLAVITIWEMVSGPGRVTFAAPDAVDTTASFSAPGDYVLRLTADDGALVSDDDTAITVTPGLFVDLGGASLGINGLPHLTAKGPLTVGSTLTIHLDDAAPDAPMLLWLSLSSSPLDVFGGTLYAQPMAAQFLFASDASGALSLAAPWPVALDPGTELYFQFLIRDLSVASHITLSNAVTAQTP